MSVPFFVRGGGSELSKQNGVNIEDGFFSYEKNGSIFELIPLVKVDFAQWG